MMQWDRMTLGRTAKEMGFVRDTFEKVCRLADVLRFMEEDELLAVSLSHWKHKWQDGLLRTYKNLNRKESKWKRYEAKRLKKA